MLAIRYINIYRTEMDEEGNYYDKLHKSNLMLPIILEPYKISTIEPYYTSNGKAYKNVSVVSYDNGDKFRIVGNYKEIFKKIKSNEINNTIGFKKDGNFK
jgi:hypothetical protein